MKGGEKANQGIILAYIILGTQNLMPESPNTSSPAPPFSHNVFIFYEREREILRQRQRQKQTDTNQSTTQYGLRRHYALSLELVGHQACRSCVVGCGTITAARI